VCRVEGEAGLVPRKFKEFQIQERVLSMMGGREEKSGVNALIRCLFAESENRKRENQKYIGGLILIAYDMD